MLCDKYKLSPRERVLESKVKQLKKEKQALNVKIHLLKTNLRELQLKKVEQ
mgnify:CR=1 FL=1